MGKKIMKFVWRNLWIAPKPTGKRPLERHCHRYEDNIRIDFKKIVLIWVNLLHSTPAFPSYCAMKSVCVQYKYKCVTCCYGCIIWEHRTSIKCHFQYILLVPVHPGYTGLRKQWPRHLEHHNHWWRVLNVRVRPGNQIFPSFFLQWKSNESTKHYSLKCCLPSTNAIDRREKNSRMRMMVQDGLVQARLIEIHKVFVKINKVTYFSTWTSSWFNQSKLFSPFS